MILAPSESQTGPDLLVVTLTILHVSTRRLLTPPPRVTLQERGDKEVCFCIELEIYIQIYAMSSRWEYVCLCWASGHSSD